MITRPRPPHADPYVPRAYGDAPAPGTTPAPARTAYHRRDAVPGTVGATARPSVSARVATPRLAPMRDVIPLRTTEHASRQRYGVPHTYVMDRDGFVSDARAFGGNGVPLPTAERITVTHADGTTSTVGVSTPAPRVTTPASDASGATIALGPADMRNACDTVTITAADGTARTVHVDGNGRIVRTTDDDAAWVGQRSTLAPRRRPAPRAAAAPRTADHRTPPARVTRDVVVMWLRATGYAGPVDARMVTLARDAMAAQRQRDAYTD